jgi:hypothetical protein
LRALSQTTNQIVDALLAELKRQAADPRQKLSVKREEAP